MLESRLRCVGRWSACVPQEDNGSNPLRAAPTFFFSFFFFFTLVWVVQVACERAHFSFAVVNVSHFCSRVQVRQFQVTHYLAKPGSDDALFVLATHSLSFPDRPAHPPNLPSSSCTPSSNLTVPLQSSGDKHDIASPLRPAQATPVPARAEVATTSYLESQSQSQSPTPGCYTESYRKHHAARASLKGIAAGYSENEDSIEKREGYVEEN